MMLAAPLRDGLDAGTTIVVVLSAAIIAGIYAIALMRLWRRVYRRCDYRVSVEMPAAIAVDGAPVALARTKDLSFGGASLESARAIPAGTEVTIRLLGEDPVALTGTVIRSSDEAGGWHRIGISFHPLPLEDEKRLLLAILEAATGTHLANVTDRSITSVPLLGPPRGRDIAAGSPRAS